ncbi:MAG TPA: VOC family protein [Blastocatellia bacterium]|nr:VOC family protein [Blastocatellia bacterium]
MRITGIEMVWLEVDSLQRSIEFYRDHLGLEVDDSDAEKQPSMASVAAGNVRIILAEEFKPMITRGRGMNLFFSVTDVDELYQEIKSRGLKVNAPIDEGWGGRFITVKDPDGYRLFFVTWK